MPFHMWTPDAYEGAPLPITAYLSATSKAAGFALLLRLFAEAFVPVIDDWHYLIAGLAAATMILGNLVALQQRNIKRLLAYSSIGQVGYMLMGIAALSPDSGSALLLHMTGYVITNLAAFVCVIIYYNWTGKEEINDFAGLAERAPLLAVVPGDRAVLAGGHAAVRRLPDEVHPLPGGGAARTCSGWPASAVTELHLALLLPDHREGDVPRQAGGAFAVPDALGRVRRAVAADRRGVPDRAVPAAGVRRRGDEHEYGVRGRRAGSGQRALRL